MKAQGQGEDAPHTTPLPCSALSEKLSTSLALVWCYVGLASASFILWAVLLSLWVKQDPAVLSEFQVEVPSQLFEWQLSAFGGVLILNVINLALRHKRAQYTCNVLLVLTHLVAFGTELCICRGWTPLVRSAVGMTFYPLRYVQWAHSTPTILVLMSMLSDLDAWQLGAMLGWDLLMIISGLLASWTSGPLQLASMVVTFAAFAPVVQYIRGIMDSAAREARDEATQQALRLILAATLVLWAAFPVVWLAVYLRMISMLGEQVAWGCLDFMAKVVYSSQLWQSNFVTILQRREVAHSAWEASQQGLVLAEMRRLLEAKERLVHSMTHELRTPLHGIMALAEELLHNGKAGSNGAAHKRLLQMIRSSAGSLLSIINATVDAASAQDGTLQLQRQRLNLWRVTEGVCRLARPLLKDDVRLLNCVSKDMPPVLADGSRLVQALFHLVGHASRTTAAGSIKISAAAGHARAQVLVADTGAGISNERLPCVLQPFDQAQEAAGCLGLYLVKQMLDAMGCDLAVSSELGRGSTFAFDLPLAASSDGDSGSEAEVAAEEQAALLVGGGEEAPSRAGSFEAVRATQVAALSASTAADSAGRANGQAAAGGGAPAAPSSVGGSIGAGPATPSAPYEVDAARGAAETGSARTPGGASPQLVRDLFLYGAGGCMKASHRSRTGVIQVLSVDDDPINQLVATTALKSHNWSVVKAMNGMEALDYLSRGCQVLPDLVMLDVMMPGMSGYEAAAQIRAMYPSSLLPIIMVSAKTEEGDVVEGLKCGADDYITKPFKRAELAARIRAHIRARDAIQQQQAAEQQWLVQHSLLPANVQRRLRNGETVVAEQHECASVLWAEVVGLPRLMEQVAPLQLVVLLNGLYSTWEELCESEGALGVDCSSSTYVAVSGHDDNPHHLHTILRLAAAMLEAVAARRMPGGAPLHVRIGVHTGPITTGLVGSKAVKFSLMGETVDVAQQLAASGCAMAVHVSEHMWEQAKGSAQWTLQHSQGNGAPPAAPFAASAASAAAPLRPSYLLQSPRASALTAPPQDARSSCVDEPALPSRQGSRSAPLLCAATPLERRLSASAAAPTGCLDAGPLGRGGRRPSSIASEASGAPPLGAAAAAAADYAAYRLGAPPPQPQLQQPEAGVLRPGVGEGEAAVVQQQVQQLWQQAELHQQQQRLVCSSAGGGEQGSALNGQIAAMWQTLQGMRSELGALLVQQHASAALAGHELVPPPHQQQQQRCGGLPFAPQLDASTAAWLQLQPGLAQLPLLQTGAGAIGANNAAGMSHVEVAEQQQQQQGMAMYNGVHWPARAAAHAGNGGLPGGLATMLMLRRRSSRHAPC